MSNRRRFLQDVAILPLAGGLEASTAVAKRDYFKELGLRPFINAAGTFTSLTGSLMAPEVVEAFDYCSKRSVQLMPLSEAVGRRIAELVGCEAALVTGGAASALTLGTIACMAGQDKDLMARIPDTTGLKKTEVIIQKAHRSHLVYDHAVRTCGVRFVEVETADELKRAASERTAMMLFYNAADPHGAIKVADFAQLGKTLKIPTFNDAAGDVPPAENLWKYIRMGYDLVTFSGGKGLLGPQSAGLLLGRRDLIEAARLNTPPNCDTIGRAMKVSKEEMVAMWVAVESYLKRDHAADWKEWESRVKTIADAISSVPTVKTERFVPVIVNAVPHLRISWDETALKITAQQATQKLVDGEPSIEVVPRIKTGMEVAVWMLRPGESQIVARRLREVLKNGA